MRFIQFLSTTSVVLGQSEETPFVISSNFAALRAKKALLIDRNLVDPASSHMLVSKIKPCMSQYKSSHGETANGSLKQL